jgi:hypothetical protein
MRLECDKDVANSQTLAADLNIRFECLFFARSLTKDEIYGGNNNG